MKGERLLHTLILAAVGLALFGFVRPVSLDPVEDSGSYKTWFFINKTQQGPDFDGVIIGDSRALRGVSADAMAAGLGGKKIFNFAFHAGGMNLEIYQEAEKLLKRELEAPIIVMAPTALSFLPIKARNEQFHENKAKPQDQVWIYRNWPGLAHWFQPVVPSVPVRKIFGNKPAKLFLQDFQADGWIATDQDPWDDQTDLTIHRDRLVGRHSDEDRISDFMDQTREWSGRGFKVFGFFPPAYEPRIVQEDSLLGFDRDSFISSFRAAGGIWLDVARDKYRSYDGSHLDSTSGLELSRDLAQEMAPYL